jgi:hypothetical protein
MFTGKRWLGILGRRWEVNVKMRYGVASGYTQFDMLIEGEASNVALPVSCA